MLPALMARRVILPALFHLYKQYRSATFTHSASRWHYEDILSHLRSTSTKHLHAGAPTWTLALTSRSSVLPSIPTEYSCVGSFLNNDKSKDVLVGIYPAQNYQSIVEFGAAIFYPSYSRLSMSPHWLHDWRV